MAIPQLAIRTGNMYLDVVHRLHQALRPLTETDADRNPKYSPTPVRNIELAPVIIDRVSTLVAPSIHISMDSSQTANDLEGESSAFIELLNLRVELYLGCDNDNYRLTTQSADLMNDFRQVLSPTHFTGAPISDDAKLVNGGILQWGFDERLRGTPEEILIYIFQVELHHYVYTGGA